MTSYQWRGYPWPHSAEGGGGKPSAEDYPFQWVSVPMGGYETAETRRSLDLRFAGQVTPFGTPVALLWRTGGDLISSKCGYCGETLAECRCSYPNGGEE